MVAHKRGTEPTQEESFCLKKLGKRIGQLTAKRGISIERLAHEGEISKGYLYDIVKGKGNPTLIILLRIASALEISLGTLLK